MFSVTLPVNNFIDCFDFYEYTSNEPTSFNGFIQPKENFKDWFKYLKCFRPEYTKRYDFNEILSPEISSYKLINSTHLFGKHDVFDFEFEDEETALYFQMKYGS